MFQIRVVALDGGTPPKQDTVVARIKVIRNLKQPKFEPTSYQAKVLETTSIGEIITRVRASDSDKRVCNYFTFSPPCFFLKLNIYSGGHDLQSRPTRLFHLFF